ncbi:MAG: hypothetical protein HOM47_07350, partial [Euryarchaeota archaeon]|nr:hypothetical protein [Euryarchaeota archaeon]
MRGFAIFVALLLLPLVTALSDLTIYAESHYENQKDAPVLVEWFHGSDDDETVRELTKMDREGEITLLHWRTGADEENGGLPDDDAKSRASIYDLDLNESFDSISYSNQHSMEIDATNNSSKIVDLMPIIDLTGEVIIAEGDNEIWYIRMPIEMTPLFN